MTTLENFQSYCHRWYEILGHTMPEPKLWVTELERRGPQEKLWGFLRLWGSASENTAREEKDEKEAKAARAGQKQKNCQARVGLSTAWSMERGANLFQKAQHFWTLKIPWSESAINRDIVNRGYPRDRKWDEEDWPEIPKLNISELNPFLMGL
jgi:hypothetical protein